MSSLARIIFDPDTTNPSIPSILSVTAVGQGRLDVTWSTSLDLGGSGLAGYNLLIDGATTLELGIQTSYSHTGLAPGSTHTYRVSARDSAGNTSGLSIQGQGTVAAAPGVYNPDYPRFGSYSLGGTQNPTDAALAANHVNVVIQWPGWQQSKGVTWAAKCASVRALSTIGTKLVPYTIYTEIQDIYSAAGTSENDVWRHVSDNGLWVYQNGLTKTNRIPSYQSGWSKINFTTAGEVVDGQNFSQWKIARDHRLNVLGGTFNNGSTNITVTPNPGGFDGVYFDNAFSREQPAVGGVPSDYNRDGVADNLASTASTNLIQSSHAANVALYRTLHPGALVLGNSNIWPIYHPGGVTGQPIDQVFDGGVLEYIEEWAGYAGSNGMVRGSTFATLLNAIRVQMNGFRPPKLGILSPLITSATNYQQLRYWHGIAALTDTYYYPHLTIGLLAQELNTLSYDEKTVSLGAAVDGVQYTPRYQAGANGAGIYVRRFQRGEVWVWAQGGTYTAQAATVDLWRLIGTNNAANTGAKISAGATIAGTAGDCAVFAYVAQDQTAPTVPGSLSATVASSSSINLNWNASTDSGGSGLGGYRVERATSSSGPWTQIADQTGTSVLATGLTVSTQYFFRVRAYDRAQNLSGFSNTANATTQSGTTGVIFGPDTFASAALSSTAAATQTAMLARGYSQLDLDLGACRIEAWPLDSSLRCFVMEYLVDQATDKLRLDMPSSTTHVIAEWDEIRSAGFDFSNMKDIRFPAFRTENSTDTIDVDIYSGYEASPRTSGVDNSAFAGIWAQGPNIAPGLDQIAHGSFNFQRAVEYHITYEIKMNSPSSSNGSVRLTHLNKSTGVTSTFQANSVKLARDGISQCVIRRVQWGMDATTGGFGFAGTSKMYRRNIQVTRVA